MDGYLKSRFMGSDRASGAVYGCRGSRYKRPSIKEGFGTEILAVELLWRTTLTSHLFRDKLRL